MTISNPISFRKYWLHIFVLSLLFCSACEEVFTPDLEGSDAPLLVIEGSITDLAGPYTIKLSFSSGIYSTEQQTVENAIVKIIEEDGAQETLSEIESGTYTTSTSGIQGTSGKSYKLSIEFQDGTQYESEFQELLFAIPIDSVGAVVENQYISIEQPEVPGHQFNVTTALAENSENYFLWTLESTFKYQADYTINYLYSDNVAQLYPNPTEFMTCWRTNQINEIYTFNTSVLSQAKVERLPINFVGADARELSIRYSLLVKQFTINEEAYTFWNNIEQQIAGQETLYNNQPFQIRGNVFNVDDPEELVLGFFMVASQDEKRIFVDPPPGVDSDREYCFPDYMGYSFITLLPESSWPIYVYEDLDGDRALSAEECFDCRVLGGSLIEPDFWVE